MYDAFVGGFNFVDPATSENFVTGTFIIERDDRLQGRWLNVDAPQRSGIVVSPDHKTVGLLTSLNDTAEQGPVFIGDRLPNSAATNFLEKNTVVSRGNGRELALDPAPGLTAHGLQAEWGQWANAAVETQNLKRNSGIDFSSAQKPVLCIPRG